MAATARELVGSRPVVGLPPHAPCARLEDRLDLLYNVGIRTPERVAKFRALHQASHPSVTATTLKMMSSTDFRTILPRVHCPALVVAADLFAQRSSEVVRQVVDAIPGARFEVLATDHIMTVQSPELVLPLLRDFLQQVEA